MIFNNTSAFPEDEFLSSPSSSDSLQSSPRALETIEDENKDLIYLHSANKVPNFEECLAEMEKYNLPKHVHPYPIFKDYGDVSSKKEIGHNVLYIESDSLKGLPIFECSVSPNKDKKTKLALLREQAFKEFVGNDEEANIEQYLSTEEVVIIRPLINPPTHSEARAWLAARSNKNADSELIARKIEEDSPEKLKIEKPINVLDTSPEKHDDSEATSSVDREHHRFEEKSSRKLETKFNFNITTKSPADLEIIDVDAISSPRPTTSRMIRSFKRKRRRWRLSLSKDLYAKSQESFMQSMLNETANKSVSRPPTPILLSSSGSNKSSEPDSISTTLMNKYMNVDSNKLNMSSAFDLTNSILENTHHFQVDLENLKIANSKCEFTFLTIFNLELHVQTRADLKPDPALDSIQAIFYTIVNDVPDCDQLEQQKTGIIVHGLDEQKINVFQRSGFKADILIVDTEKKLFEHFLQLVRKVDPDILSGFEIERSSWGYLIDRGNVLGIDMLVCLSRVLPSERKRPEIIQTEDDPGAGADKEYENDIQIRGRILLNVWRLIRHEIALTSYTFENIVYHVLHQRIPLHSYAFMTHKWQDPSTIWIVVQHFIYKSTQTLKILNTLDLVGRTCELAKLFGIQFFEVLSRGSQFRVESMMMRISKPMNYVSISPSVQQRAVMRAPEYLPLILEPLSRFYSDPLIVLDFQSLYPSMIIAYNYCFSTCLGRVEYIGK